MHIDSGALDGITRKPVENERKSVSRYKGIDRFIYELRGGFMGISFSNIGTVGREQLITSGSNGEPNWSYIPSKGKSTKKANNRTYQFADEKTKKQIAYMSGYYLQTVPQSVKAAYLQQEKEFYTVLASKIRE